MRPTENIYQLIFANVGTNAKAAGRIAYITQRKRIYHAKKKSVVYESFRIVRKRQDFATQGLTECNINE